MEMCILGIRMRVWILSGIDIISVVLFPPHRFIRYAKPYLRSGKLWHRFCSCNFLIKHPPTWRLCQAKQNATLSLTSCKDCFPFSHFSLRGVKITKNGYTQKHSRNGLQQLQSLNLVSPYSWTEKCYQKVMQQTLLMQVGPVMTQHAHTTLHQQNITAGLWQSSYSMLPNQKLNLWRLDSIPGEQQLTSYDNSVQARCTSHSQNSGHCVR